MDMFQDGVEVGILPDDAHCKLDDNKEYILDLEECPLGHYSCSGLCCYYTEEADKEHESTTTT